MLIIFNFINYGEEEKKPSECAQSQCQADVRLGRVEVHQEEQKSLKQEEAVGK